jgi:hypothetical protein
MAAAGTCDARPLVLISRKERLMTPMISRWVAPLSLAAALAAGSSTIAPQQASAARCEHREGALQLWDADGATPADPFAANSCAYFSGDNAAWGPYGWSHRAEDFLNQGRTHNVFVYQFANRGGMWHFLGRKEYWRSANFGDSNYWTMDPG